MANKYKGKTFAQIADMLQKESASRPNDPVSKRTLDEMMSRLMNAQEEYNMLKEQRKLAKMVDNMSTEEKAMLMSSLAQPMAQEQEGIDLGQPMYAKGGKIHIAKNKRGTFTAAAKKHGKSVQAFASQVLAHPENYSPAMRKKANFARNSAKWHSDGGHLFVGGGPEDWEAAYYSTYSDPPEGTWYNPETDTYNMPLQLGLTTNYVLPLDTPYQENLSHAVKTNEIMPLPTTTQNPKGGAPINQTKSNTNVLGQFGNLSNLRYMPAVGSAVAALQAALQDKDFTLANQYRDIASQYKPVAAPHIGGYRRYNLYDINLGDAENIALTAKAIEANRGQNRATQGALNAAIIANAQKTAAQRNLAAQQANEANRLATDTYNLGIDQFNAQRDTQYDQLNQQILANRLRTLMSAAQAEDLSKQAWANMYNTTHENFFNQLGNVGRDSWNRNQRDALLTALGAEGIKELMKSADGRAWLTSMGYKG